ncbi:MULTISPECIES: beta-ketoacyl-[acyl-carrier-protein] synthase family protein [Streptomyces]|uniref:Beta-ketoacyl-[acyl-carrier-protein] synthase family protein n=1 Tax=Streptomyces ardesiacus TaxID=285564 RepID=A0ABW8HIK0_9ACTN|nr:MULTISPECIES: beta-ketoacyl-[acyl-carrier-protein] synthase family protein [Streptomyces]KOT94800.1 3-oxoacyl-ACP synthase [Streptomyces sp. NRRL F-4711]KOX28529.1 3-oxoacyl-ACP synthase [Streptomyces sp. NRRL F-4707]MCL7370297.1 beta-ketoacyl-[acyl-carrier-protein] synthase family protein [Streptomyces ardesiacus]NEB62582.1 beta-ketoacyl-[acyl-carrier-protein] synthase family protein [Streptomyces diastaticus]
MDRRVVITGLGPVTSIGIGVAAFGAGLRAGRSGVSPITSFDTTGFPHVMGAEVRDFEPASLLRRLDPRQWGLASRFAAAAARLAVEDSGVDPDRIAGPRSGASIGTCTGESQVLQSLTEEWVREGFGAMSPHEAAQAPTHQIGSAVHRELGFTGDSMMVSAACAASNYTIGNAYDLIAGGELDYMIAGGADAMVRWGHAGFYRCGLMAEDACSPFDRDRTGVLAGEGASALFLETLDSAVERGARIYAEVLGYGLSCDARHPVAPDADGIARCIRRAHANAGVTPQDVDYICAHGTGTPANDLTEANAVRDVFGPTPPPMSSIKSMLGHTMGAASGLGAIASVLGIREGFMPPTINYGHEDPALTGIDPVPNAARPARLRVVQNNGFAFGGNNAVTLFGEVA